MDGLYDKVGNMLALAYMRVNWKKMGKRSSYDVFQHRLKTSSSQSSVTRFIDKLCKGLSLQSISAKTEDIEYLEERKEEVLRMIREESVYLTLLAAKKAKEMKKKKKEEKEEK
jgi:hypothetical protein